MIGGFDGRVRTNLLTAADGIHGAPCGRSMLEATMRVDEEEEEEEVASITVRMTVRAIESVRERETAKVLHEDCWTGRVGGELLEETARAGTGMAEGIGTDRLGRAVAEDPTLE